MMEKQNSIEVNEALKRSRKRAPLLIRLIRPLGFMQGTKFLWHVEKETLQSLFGEDCHLLKEAYSDINPARIARSLVGIIKQIKSDTISKEELIEYLAAIIVELSGVENSIRRNNEDANEHYAKLYLCARMFGLKDTTRKIDDKVGMDFVKNLGKKYSKDQKKIAKETFEKLKSGQLTIEEWERLTNEDN